MASEKEKLEVQVTTQGADRAAKELDKVSKEADKLDKKKIEVGGLDLGSDADLLSSKLSGLAGPGGIIAGLGAGMAFVANSTADAAIEADNLASLTGDNVETASRLNAVWKATGAETKDLQDVLLQMNGVLATNAAIAEQLGINLDDGATVGQRFEQVAEALDKIPDAAKRSQIASQVFGEEGVRQYNALRQSVGDVGEAMANVASGQVFDEGDVEQARKMKQELSELKGELIGLSNSAGKLAIPAINGVIDGFKRWFDAAGDAGQTTRDFLRGDFSFDNQHVVDALEDGEAAAASFDRTLLDGLTTFADVRAKVIEVTDSERAANIVALEWNATMGDQADVVGGVSEALDSADATWQRYIDTLGGTSAAGQGASGSFKEMQAAADAAIPSVEDLDKAAQDAADKGLSILADAAQAVADAVDSAFSDFNDDLGTLDQLDTIADDFDTVAEKAKAAQEGGAKGAREHAKAVRDLRRDIGHYVEELDGIEPDKKVEILTSLRGASVDQLKAILDDLTKDRFINIAVSPKSIPLFQSVNASFTPGSAPSAPTFNGQSAIPSQPIYDNRQITIIQPVGSTPTTHYIDGQIDYRRNGIR